MKTLIVRTAGSCMLIGAAATAMTIRAAKKISVPKESLLELEVLGQENSQEGKNVFVDIFEIRLESPRIINVDEYIQGFFSSPVFRLELSMLKYFGLIEKEAVTTIPHRFNSGQSFALWSVKCRRDLEGEVLFSWISSRFPKYSGTTYFRLFQEVNRVSESAGKVTSAPTYSTIFQFGSTLVVPREFIVSESLFQAHYLYSRILLLGTAVKLDLM